MAASLNVKSYVISALFLLAAIAIPYYYLFFFLNQSAHYDYSVAPDLKTVPLEEHVLVLDSSSFTTVTSASRKHAALVILTTLNPKFKCTPCLKLHAGFSQFAQSFLSKNSTYPLFFAYLDFAEGREIFQKLKVEHVPKILLYLPKEGEFAVPKGNEDMLDFMSSGPEALSEAALADWISSSINQPFKYSPPLNKTLVLVVVSLGAIALLLIKWTFPLFSYIFSNRSIWFTFTLAFVLLMTSGYMWNQIRHPPFASSDEHGNPIFVSPQFSHQYEAETYLVAIMHFICALSSILLISVVPKLSSSFQKYSSIVLLAVIVFTYSRFLRIFSIKNAGYPYHLL